MQIGEDSWIPLDWDLVDRIHDQLSYDIETPTRVGLSQYRRRSLWGERDMIETESGESQALKLNPETPQERRDVEIVRSVLRYMGLRRMLQATYSIAMNSMHTLAGSLYGRVIGVAVERVWDMKLDFPSAQHISPGMMEQWKGLLDPITPEDQAKMDARAKKIEEQKARIRDVWGMRQESSTGRLDRPLPGTNPFSVDFNWGLPDRGQGTGTATFVLNDTPNTRED